jgi:hypothetical protein
VAPGHQEQAARYREKALIARALKADMPNRFAERKLEQIARDYERMAAALETGPQTPARDGGAA